MRKIALFILLLFCVNHGFSASTPVPVNTPPLTAKDVMIPLAGTGQLISLEEFVKLTPKSYQLLTGKKMTLGQKIDFNIRKLFLKKAIRKDGSVSAEKMKRTGFFSGWQWHWGGFALGFFLSFLGPIVALFFNDDYKWDRFWTALHTSLWLFLIFGAIAAAIAGGA